MGIEHSLFAGRLIHLGAIQYEKDAEIEARWTHDPEYLRLLDESPVRPRSVSQVKKQYEEIEKEANEHHNMFYYTIRARPGNLPEASIPDSSADPNGDRLIGFVKIYWIEWTHGNGWVKIGIGDPGDRGHGFGTEAFKMVMRYAFTELNLTSLSVSIPGDNPIALHVFKKAGFIEEVRRREAIQRDGEWYDLIHLGILKDEWINDSTGKRGANDC